MICKVCKKEITSETARKGVTRSGDPIRFKTCRPCFADSKRQQSRQPGTLALVFGDMTAIDLERSRFDVKGAQAWLTR